MNAAEDNCKPSPSTDVEDEGSDGLTLITLSLLADVVPEVDVDAVVVASALS